MNKIETTIGASKNIISPTTLEIPRENASPLLLVLLHLLVRYSAIKRGIHKIVPLPGRK